MRFVAALMQFTFATDSNETTTAAATSSGETSPASSGSVSVIKVNIKFALYTLLLRPTS